jgi:hypothetical protein
MNRRLILTFHLAVALSCSAAPQFGELVFEDAFERSESQEEKDEPGNGWTTNSDSRAKGNKQVDLRDGYLHVKTHSEADHAATVNRDIDLKDGTIGIRLKFEESTHNIHLNFADPREKTVHAGHLFHVSINPNRVQLTDLKYGQQNLAIRSAYQKKTLSDAQKTLLKSKSKRLPNKLETGQWHQVFVTISGDTISCTINGKKVGAFSSAGFDHARKRKLRLHVAKSVSIDDVRIWVPE